MKSLISLLLIILVFSGCTKDNNTTQTNPFGGDKGQVTFWASHSNTADFPITVSVAGQVIGTIGGPLTAQPDCQGATDKVVKFVAEPGTYNIVGKSNNGNWTGTITVTTGSCNTQSFN
jgi:hypothetical protein